LSQCPCNSGKTYEECCELYHDGVKIAPTAEATMRARYSAYVYNDIDYIKDTYLDEDDDFDYNGTKRWAESSVWEGLSIKSVEKGSEEDDEGFVEFVAYYTDENGKSSYHQEKSLFKKVDGKWMFVEGIFEGLSPITRDKPKVGRNEPCPCGSGKKFKKCCGA
jgi:SEC-C motif-containing protein